MIWQPEFTDKTLSRKPGAVQSDFCIRLEIIHHRIPLLALQINCLLLGLRLSFRGTTITAFFVYGTIEMFMSYMGN
jgi:hypothetical protein